MTKAEKIAVLDTAMTSSKRDDGTVFNHFSETAPRELTDLFLEHYEVRDQDYEIFGQALSIVSEVFTGEEKSLDEQEEAIYEAASDSASVYTTDLLAYLTMWNEADISKVMREYGLHSIAEACAVWYDRQVEQAAVIIKDWVNA